MGHHHHHTKLRHRLRHAYHWLDRMSREHPGAYTIAVIVGIGMVTWFVRLVWWAA